MRYADRFSYTLMDDDDDDLYPKCSPSMMPMPEIRLEQNAPSRGNAASRCKHAIKGLLKRTNSKESNFSYPASWIQSSASQETPRGSHTSSFFMDENSATQSSHDAGSLHYEADKHAYNTKHAFKAAFERPGGVQVSAPARGALGRPLSNITNRGSRRGIKPMAVVPEHSDDKDVPTFDGLYFSDGRFLSYTVEDAPELCNSDCSVLPFSARHQAAVFSPDDIILCLDTGYLPDEHQLLRGPVTAGKIAAAMRAFYATRISPAQYDFMIAAGRARARESRADFEVRLQTYGDLKRDKIFFEGLSIVSVEPLMYRINWASWLG